MPNYALTCSDDACQHKWQQFAHMSERHSLSCPACGRINPHTDFSQTKAPSVPHDWIGDEARSLKLSFDPSGISELKREAPSIELGKSGDVYFRNDRHQKRVFREMAATKRRYEEEAEARLNRRKATHEDVTEAAAAVRRFMASKANQPTGAGTK